MLWVLNLSDGRTRCSTSPSAPGLRSPRSAMLRRRLRDAGLLEASTRR